MKINIVAVFNNKMKIFQSLCYCFCLFVTLTGMVLAQGNALLPASMSNNYVVPLPDSSEKGTGMPIRLIFVGDIMVHATQLEIAQTNGEYNFHPCFEVIRPWLKGDLVIGNFETVLGGYPRFNSPDSLATALHDVGFTTLLLANNHIFDHGIRSAKRTVEVLQANNLRVTGLTGVCPSPLLIEVKGVRIGIFNYTYGSNSPVNYHATASVSLNIIDKNRISEDIAQLRKQGADYIVATFHWGEEYSTEPSSFQRNIAHYCLDLGVDAIIGTHPHVLQPIEVQRVGNKNCVIAWSLGNFISSQRTLPRERSIIFALDILPGTDGVILHRVSVAPTWVDLSRPCKSAKVLPAISGFYRAANSLHDSSDAAATSEVVYTQHRSDVGQDRISLKSIIVNQSIARKLLNVEFTIRTFLNLPATPDKDGFYTVFKSNDY